LFRIIVVANPPDRIEQTGKLQSRVKALAADRSVAKGRDEPSW
jgi:hypothetical protein